MGRARSAWPGTTVPTLIAALDAFRRQSEPADLPLRLPIQDVYKFDDRRILAGRIESGRLKVGDRLLFSPSNKAARVALDRGVACRGSPTRRAPAQSIGITPDEQIFVERGELASHETHAPIETNVFRGRLFWLGRKPLTRGQFAIGCACRRATCR